MSLTSYQAAPPCNSWEGETMLSDVAVSMHYFAISWPDVFSRDASSRRRSTAASLRLGVFAAALVFGLGIERQDEACVCLVLTAEAANAFPFFA